MISKSLPALSRLGHDATDSHLLKLSAQKAGFLTRRLTLLFISLDLEFDFVICRVILAA